jgi:molecular chaperone GrpE (heat shock protein)
LEAEARAKAAALERDIAGKQRELQELSSSTDREQQEIANSRRRMQATMDSKVEGLGALASVKAAKLMSVGGRQG